MFPSALRLPQITVAGRDVDRAAVKHVLMTTDAVGGVWQYSCAMAEGLAEAGVKVTLAVLGPAPEAEQVAEARAIPGLSLHTHGGRLEWMDDPWADVDDAGRFLVALAGQCEAQLVHLNGYAYATAGFAVPTLVVGHSCVLSWWPAVKGEEAPPKAWAVYRRRVKEGLAATNGVVAPSAAMLTALQRHYAVVGGRVIHNGRAFRPPATEAKEPFVLSAGRLWDEGKNIAALARVAARLPWQVRLAGAVASHADARAARERQFAPARCLGRLGREELASQYARAAIYAAPALYEPFGLAILEAASAGCALVLGDVPSLHELWDDAALFVDPRDDEALTRALRALIERPGLRSALAVRAAARARVHGPGKMVQGYLDLYGQLLARRGDRPHQVTGPQQGESRTCDS